MPPIAPALRWILGPALLAVLCSCAIRPGPLAGEFPDFQPEQATERSIDARVRWGGTLVETMPESDQTCMEILAMDLARDYRPVDSDNSRGRFIACKDEFLEPETFRPGREVTVIGRLDGFTTGNVGEFEYRYPRLDAETVYLWPQAPDYAGYPADIHYFAPWPYFHGFRPHDRHPRYYPVRPRAQPHASGPVTLREAARRARDD